MHLYLHVPFCQQACYYCDFHFSTLLKYQDLIVDAMCQEIVLTQHYLQNKRLETIYLGGGTPSVISSENLTKIFDEIQKYYSLEQLQETTIECNPEDINAEKLELFKALHINRISLGIQTFDDHVLQQMNRAHTALKALESIQKIQNFGGFQLSLDLIYGFPATDHTRLKTDLTRLIGFQPDHISAYNLTIEKQTVLGKRTQKKQFIPAEEDFHAAEFEIVYEALEKAGYEAYEISNFAKDKHYAVHNTAYWRGDEYLGIGPSAHSYNLQSRSYNIANNQLYAKSIAKGTLPAEMETLTVDQQANELLMTGLRTIWGVSLPKLQSLIPNWLIINRKEIDKLIKTGELIIENDIIFLTHKGRIIADKITADLFISL